MSLCSLSEYVSPWPLENALARTRPYGVMDGARFRHEFRTGCGSRFRLALGVVPVAAPTIDLMPLPLSGSRARSGNRQSLPTARLGLTPPPRSAADTHWPGSSSAPSRWPCRPCRSRRAGAPDRPRSTASAQCNPLDLRGGNAFNCRSRRIAVSNSANTPSLTKSHWGLDFMKTALDRDIVCRINELPLESSEWEGEMTKPIRHVTVCPDQS